MTACAQQPIRRPQPGFTMVELLVAIAIVGLLMAVTVPGSMRFYQSIQYRQAVRDVLTTLGQARHQAMDKGQAQNVGFDAERGQIQFYDDVYTVHYLHVRRCTDLLPESRSLFFFF